MMMVVVVGEFSGSATSLFGYTKEKVENLSSIEEGADVWRLLARLFVLASSSFAIYLGKHKIFKLYNFI